VEISVNSKDEVGQLAESLKNLTVRLVTYIAYIGEISDTLDEFGRGNFILNLTHSYDGEFASIKILLYELLRYSKRRLERSPKFRNRSLTAQERLQMAPRPWLRERWSRQVSWMNCL